MKIRPLENNEIEEVVELWYETSIKAHDFIPAEFWLENKKNMAEIYLPGSETSVAVLDGVIVGFVSMMDNFLAAIFVRLNKQGHGIGKQLMDTVKEKNRNIRLNVYKKNEKTIGFYRSQGFSIVSETFDNKTGETELLMEYLDE